MAKDCPVSGEREAPLRPGLRVLLAGLRALALLTLIAILCRPVVSLAVPGGAARGVLLLLDRSRSMTLAGAQQGETRDEELMRAAASVRRELEDEYPLVSRPFAEGLGAPLEEGLMPLPDGESTDLARALEEGMAGGGPQGRPGAMVLVSDGTVTEGADPVTAARKLGIPVQTVALGSPQPMPDLAVVRMRANREAFAGERTPVEAVVRMQGLEALTVQARLLDVTDGEREVASVAARVEPGGAETRIDLSFVPPRPGLRYLEVRLPLLPGEATGANNRRLLAIDVREEKTGVVLLSGQLTWDHTFLRRALEADSTLAVILSMIPVFTPLLMMLRIAVKMPPVWQILLAYALTALFTLFMVWAAARIYRIGILMYGKKPTPKEILRWARVS